MSWTNPAAHIYAVSEVVTASTMNTYIEANLAILGALPGPAARTGARALGYNTSSTSAAEIDTFMRPSITVPPSGVVRIILSGWFELTSGTGDLYFSAGPVGGSSTGLGGMAFNNTNVGQHFYGWAEWSGLTVGATFTAAVYWYVSAGITAACPANSRTAANNDTYVAVETR